MRLKKIGFDKLDPILFVHNLSLQFQVYLIHAAVWKYNPKFPPAL